MGSHWRGNRGVSLSATAAAETVGYYDEAHWPQVFQKQRYGLGWAQLRVFSPRDEGAEGQSRYLPGWITAEKRP